MTAERESGDTGGSQPDDEDIETWPPEEEPAGSSPPQAPSPDHEQARQGTRRPPTDDAPHGGGPGGMNDQDATNWAAGAHLASLVVLVGVPPILGPLVVWLVKREDHPFVADQARESLNFQISVLIYTIVGGLAALILTIATVGLGLIAIVPIAIVFAIGVFLLPIVAAIKASEGRRYRYPLTLRLVSGSEGTPTPR